MIPAAGRPGGVEDRFPGFEVLGQVKYWDPVTAGVVFDRIGISPDIRFFTPVEEATATALFDRLVDQDPDSRLPVVAMVDARLAEDQTDGWRYEDMPEDGQAWRDSLARLLNDARVRYDVDFATCSVDEQNKLLQAIQDTGSGDWHGMNAAHVWSLWTRYACTAFYSHPAAWNEIGFSGPAYPRGYKNAGVDRREPFEVADAQPGNDPAHGTTS
jgi:hypothetical protein